MKTVIGKKGFVARFVCVTLGIFLTHHALAADVTSFKPAAPNTGRVVDAFTLDEGKFNLGLNLDYDGSVYFNEGNKDDAVKDVLNTSAVLSTGITKDLQLSVGIRGTNEVVNEEARASAMQDIAEYKEGAAKRTAFSGLTLMPQYRFYSDSDLSFAGALMLESGTMGKETYSLTRSDRFNGGWMLIGTYGQPKSTIVSANVGYRYRFPERVTDHYYRNELFYRGAVTSYVIPEMALFTSLEARRLMKGEDNKEMESGARKYRPTFSSGINAGLKMDLAGTELSVYAGRSMASGIGQGTKTFGLTLNMPLGEGARSSEDEETISDTSSVSAPSTKSKKKALGPLGEEEAVDWERDMEKANAAAGKTTKSDEDLDDFELLERRQKAEKEKYKGKPTPDEIQEREYERLKKKKEEQARREEIKREREERRQAKRDYDEMKVRERKMRGWEKDVKKELDEYPTVSDEEAQWNGLE